MAATYDFLVDEKELLQTLLILKSVLRGSAVSIRTYNNYAALNVLVQNYEKKKIVLTFQKLGEFAFKILTYLNEKIEVPLESEEDVFLEDWERMWAAEVIRKAVSLRECC